MPLGREVGLGPGHIVLDGDPAPPQKGAQPPIFWPMSIVAKRLDGSRYATWYEGGLCPGNIVLHADPAPPQGAHLPIFGPRLLWAHGWRDEDATW